MSSVYPTHRNAINAVQTKTGNLVMQNTTAFNGLANLALAVTPLLAVLVAVYAQAAGAL